MPTYIFHSSKQTEKLAIQDCLQNGKPKDHHTGILVKYRGNTRSTFIDLAPPEKIFTIRIRKRKTLFT